MGKKDPFTSGYAEIQKFLSALRNCKKNGTTSDLQEGIGIAILFIEKTGEIFKSITSNPWGVIGTILGGGKYDPYSDLHPLSKAFRDKWIIGG